MCSPLCDMGVRTGESVTPESVWRGGGVVGRTGEEEGSRAEEEGGGNKSRAGFGEVDGPAWDEDACAEDVLASTRVKRSRLTSGLPESSMEN